MRNIDKITDRLLKFDLFRNNATEKLHDLMHVESSDIEETMNSVYKILLNNDTPNHSIDYKTKDLQIYNIPESLPEILHVKKIERFSAFTKTKSLKHYKDNYNNLITAALFQQDKISIPFCFDNNCENSTYLNYIKDNKLEKILEHINITTNNDNKIIFIPFFVDGKFFEFIKLTGNENMPMQVKIAEGIKGLFQIADMAIIDKHRDFFSQKKRYNYEICNTKLLNANKKMQKLVNSAPEDLNIDIVANNELKSLLKIIVKDNEKFIKMFEKDKIRGTSSTIVESFYEQEIIHLKKKNLDSDIYNKISYMYKSVLAISALEVVLGAIDSKQFLRTFRINQEIDLKKKYEEFLLENIKAKLNKFEIDLTIYGENNLNIFTENKIKAQRTDVYIDKIRNYHCLITKRLHKANDEISEKFAHNVNIKKLRLFPILNLDNLLGHGPIDGDDMLRDVILNDPDKLHILLFELVPDAPHFWKKIYSCFNHLAEASNTLIAFNETIFDVVVNNYLPSEKKGFHFDDSDEIIIIIDDEDQLQMLHIEVFIKFLNNCYENNKKIDYVSDKRGLIEYLKISTDKNKINARFDKVNQYILDKVKVSTAKKPIIFNFSETKLQYPGDKLHELLCTLGDYQGKSILFGYSSPSSLALMEMYNKHFERKKEVFIQLSKKY